MMRLTVTFLPLQEETHAHRACHVADVYVHIPMFYSYVVATD